MATTSMNIALCEDDEIQAQRLVDCIHAWVSGRSGPEYSKVLNDTTISQQLPAVPMPVIRQYADAEKFFFNYEEQGPFDLLFLDIDLSGKVSPVLRGAKKETGACANNETLNEDGLRIARRIREKDPHVVIVFVTNNTNHVFDGYKVQAFDFLPKPVQQEEVERILDHTNRHVRNAIDQSFLIDTSLGIKRIILADIYYFEAQRHFIELQGVYGKETFRARFADIISELTPRDFISPHRSYLVNVAYIQRFTKNSITMTDGRVIPIARSREKDIARAWLDYFGEGTVATDRDSQR